MNPDMVKNIQGVKDHLVWKNSMSWQGDKTWGRKVPILRSVLWPDPNGQHFWRAGIVDKFAYRHLTLRWRWRCFLRPSYKNEVINARMIFTCSSQGRLLNR
jgi:hypothetical protein